MRARGWKAAKIEDIAQVINGGTPKTKVPEYWDGDHLWVTPAEMGGLNNPYIGSSRRKLTDAGLKNSSASLMPKNSVILSTRAPIGHLVINTEPMAFNQGCRGLIPCGEVHYKYLYYFLYTSVELLNELGSGTTFKELSAVKLKKVEILVPPLSEQKRIVAILDEAFAGIATVVANTEKNLANARELFESYLSAVFSQRDDGWNQYRLVDVVTRLTNGYVGPTRGIYQTTGIPYLLARHVKDNRLTFDGKTFVTRAFNSKNKKSILKYDDVLLVQSGHIGHSAVVPREHEGHNCHAMIVLTTVKDIVSGLYLSLFFSTSSMQEEFQRIRSGSTVPHLTCREVKELMVKIPALDEQKSIVEHSQEVEARVLELVLIGQKKMSALAELKQSLLKKVFSGELTAEKDVSEAIRKADEIP